MDALEADKTQLAEEKPGLETSKTKLKAKKGGYAALRAVAKIAQEAAAAGGGSGRALGNQITANLSAFKSLRCRSITEAGSTVNQALPGT